MRALEFTQPKTPDQQRLDSLKANKDRAAQALKTERERQKRTKALATLKSIQPKNTVTPSS